MTTMLLERPTLPPQPVRSTAQHVAPIQDDYSCEDIHIAAERALWRAVIVQTLMDASCTSQKPEAIQAKQDAMVWLRGNSRDFMTVAHYAGFCPEFLKRMATRALEQGCQWRALPGEGARQRPERKSKSVRKASQRR